jgi:hypothetical protein
VSAIARNGVALLVATVLAWCAILVLRGLLFAATLGSSSEGLAGILWMTFIGSLPELLVYAAATALLLRLLPSFRRLRWVLAFASVGMVVYVATSRWMFFGNNLADAPIGEALAVLLGQGLPIVLHVVAPLVGTGVGWWLWRLRSRPSAAIPA